jgi:shikimate dehydrogenase
MSDLFDFEREPDEYAVMGNPITHSKSPLIHTAFAEQTRQSIRYRAIQVDPGGFDQAVGNFFAVGGKGLNITVPFKQEAWKLANSLSERARLAGAVNTLKPDDEGKLFGDNTDGIGLVRDLKNNLGVTIADKKILLLGAGGAARGVLSPLVDEHPAQIVIANRTASRAHELAQQFNAQRKNVGLLTGAGFNELGDMQFDIVINATSASLAGDLPPIPADCLANAAIVYDMMYGKNPTPFLVWAKQQGAEQISDGLGMLVEQAAESFFIWRNVKPETQSVIKSIRDKLSAEN